MRLVEIPEFYNRLAGRMNDERLAALQQFLIQNPGAGNVMQKAAAASVKSDGRLKGAAKATACG